MVLRKASLFLCSLLLIYPAVPGQSPDKGDKGQTTPGQSSDKGTATPGQSPEQSPDKLDKNDKAPATPEQSPEQSPDADKRLTIPGGTELQLSMRDPVSSKLSEVGDEVLATLRRDLVVDGFKLLQEGTEFIGRVTLAQPARRMLKGGHLQVTFDRVRIDGRERKLYSIIKSASNFTRDEKMKSDGEGTLNGGTDGGKLMDNLRTAATLGGVGATVIILSTINRGPGGGIGTAGAIGGPAVLGGSVVAGILLTKGKEVRLDPGTIVRLKLEKSLAVD